jgi:hypothetical protein
MALLAGTHYDPSTAVSKATTALLAMTALDTTNLRLTFTAPSNGTVLVRMRGVVGGATTFPNILFGVLNGSTVMARQSPLGAIGGTALATTGATQEAVMLIKSLTPGASYTFDAAYGVEVILAATALKYGGPNDTTANNAWGGFIYEIYDTANLLGGANYDPATAGSVATTANLAMTAIDTTNLRITFTAPSSGIVMVRLRGVLHGATTFPQVMFGVLSGSTVMGRGDPMASLKTTAVATAQMTQESEFLVTGLTSGASYTFDAAYSVETLVAATGIKFGGPNDTTTNNAFGGFSFDIWSV